jgi:hypothetical protein
MLVANGIAGHSLLVILSAGKESLAQGKLRVAISMPSHRDCHVLPRLWLAVLAMTGKRMLLAMTGEKKNRNSRFCS